MTARHETSGFVAGKEGSRMGGEASCLAGMELGVRRTSPIVLIEDNAVIATVLRHFFGSGRQRVLVFNAPDTAFAYLSANRASLIVLADTGQRLTSLELISKLRAEGANVATPAVMMCARVSDLLKAEGTAAGVTHFLQKPVRLKDLMAVLAQVGMPPPLAGASPETHVLTGA